MRINYNISSIIARNCLNNNDTRLSDSIKRLSSGYKINSAADDAAGLAISLKMSAQLRCLKQANNNANDGVSVVNTADGAMTEMHEILQSWQFRQPMVPMRILTVNRSSWRLTSWYRSWTESRKPRSSMHRICWMAALHTKDIPMQRT